MSKKVSNHTETATATTGHNDRSIYAENEVHGKRLFHYCCGQFSSYNDYLNWLNNELDFGEFYGRSLDERDGIFNDDFDYLNDLKNKGDYEWSSSQCERQFYEAIFAETLRAQNERAVASGHVENVKSMDDYYKAHMPKETIVQLGKAGDCDDTENWTYEAFEITKRHIEENGGVVLSADCHVGEQTKDANGNIITGAPHVHIRYVMLAKDKYDNPVVNVKQCLKDHGVPLPKPDKKEGKYNNYNTTFLTNLRADLEASADAYEQQRGREATDKTRDLDAEHRTVEEYKAYQRYLEWNEKANDEEQRALVAASQCEQALREKDKAIAVRNQATKDAEAKQAECDSLDAEIDLRNRKIATRDKKIDELDEQIEDKQRGRDLLEDTKNNFFDEMINEVKELIKHDVKQASLSCIKNNPAKAPAHIAERAVYDMQRIADEQTDPQQATRCQTASAIFARTAQVLREEQKDDDDYMPDF